MKGLDKLVSKLINAGANANMVGYSGFTAMIWAAQEGHDTVVRHLFNGGADGLSVFGTQLGGTLLYCLWAAVTSAIVLYVLKITLGLRVSAEVEKAGLDVSEHGESVSDSELASY